MWVYLRLYKAYIGIMEKNMETTGVIGVTWSLLRGCRVYFGPKNLTICGSGSFRCTFRHHKVDYCNYSVT